MHSLEYVTDYVINVGDELAYFDDLELRIQFYFSRKTMEPDFSAMTLWSRSKKMALDLPKWQEDRIWISLLDTLREYGEKETEPAFDFGGYKVRYA